ncbi:EGF domain-specific O-linked N-acetylglucosamine transferase [Cylas formicarius]|uniref:EGF domain-specific O-linked N-acetylglucosamine transferase n=1 Tax=Cylas formicarius TaxID=197179 RepID=UPI002958697C|nr:EGF domain-specific O-linked N-acetylglucosamine transferase [Cylas formicarius]
MILLCLLLSVYQNFVISDNFSYINLPEEHLPYYFTSFPDIAKKCRLDPTCPYTQYLDKTRFWGYHLSHKWGSQYSKPDCPGDHKGWVKTKFEQKNTFYTQGDFGYIKQQLKELKILCKPFLAKDSSLECTDHLRYCRGQNILINFTRIDRTEPIRYKMNVLSEGDIGGFCDLNKSLLQEHADHISALQSWGPELRYFVKLKNRPIMNEDCDVVIETPTYIMKLDASVNMYHHFCDFLNLYMSLHMNPRFDTFSTDVHILTWETFTYKSLFEETWKAFTDHPIWDLKTFSGNVVCFKNAIFPLLPRMIFGLYYNTPLIYGCQKSGLFHAFSRHILHRLKIPIHKRKSNRIRITFLSRDTKYRRILNEEHLLNSIKVNEEYEVQHVVYNRKIPFKKQLEITANSDLLVGIHGAGLTHLLFLPDWAVIFELYNCEDSNCYFDLARLRGIKYVTWEDTEKLILETDDTHDGGAHAKFANYSFDVYEFKRLIKTATDHVKDHAKFKEFIRHDEL